MGIVHSFKSGSSTEVVQRLDADAEGATVGPMAY